MHLQYRKEVQCGRDCHELLLQECVLHRNDIMQKFFATLHMKRMQRLLLNSHHQLVYKSILWKEFYFVSVVGYLYHYQQGESLYYERYELRGLS